MKYRTKKEQHSQKRKRKIASALCMLLVSSILMVTASYAWLVMSVSPEVKGIATNVGANGALEIALLTTTTRQDMTKIDTMGGSLATRDPSANNTWGNLVDLSYESYGLNNITLWPARLNAIGSNGRYTIDGGMLSVPTYGYDGRIIDLTDNTVSALYDSEDGIFSYINGLQDYGVRAIGTADALSVQGSALATAKSNISTYKNSARNAASAALNTHGVALFDIVFTYASNKSGATFDDADLETIEAILSGVQSSLNYLDLALRQGLVAVAASEVSDEDLFNTVRDAIVDTSTELSQLIETVGGNYTLPADFEKWVNTLDDMQNDVNAAASACNALTDGSYTWSELRGALDKLMNVDYIFIGEDKFTELNAETLMGMIGQDVTVTLAPGSGVLADIADFTEDYSTWIQYLGMEIEIITMTMQKPVYLDALSAALKDLEAADNSASETEFNLDTTYGYALDLAFRTNVPISDLLLQTEAMQRSYSNPEEERLQGGGSYMEFSSGAEEFGLEQMLTLMDAIRVAFTDDQGNLLCIAKLNTSNRQVTDGVVKAPLYLYDFTIEEDGMLTMGERQINNSTITALEQNVAKAVTVLVWLDGDVVDNTMVAATEELSLSGTLNLQFASSADLVPAHSSLIDVSEKKGDLETLVEEKKETIEQGQRTYTTVSWKAYTAAFEYARAVLNNPRADENQVYKAAYNLTLASENLTNVSHEALQAKITEIRTLMGQTTDLARYVFVAEDGSYYAASGATEAQVANSVGQIYRVNYENNLKEEGNDIKTPIYTDESWMALASALYEAETVDMDAKAADAAIDAALTALKTAHEALERKVFYLPFDYNGDLYYFASTSETDTYGKWYYDDFTRVVSDLQILKLDAQAVPVVIGRLVQNGAVNSDTPIITPFVELLADVYPSLADEEIIGAKWSDVNGDIFVEVMGSAHAEVLQKLIAKAVELNPTLDDTYQINTADAEDLYDKYESTKDAVAGYVTVEAANAVITELQNAIMDAIAAKNAADERDMTLPMTADQRTLLTTAVNSAKTVEGYEDATKTELETLRAATTAVEALLAGDVDVTKQEATDALAHINEALVANGKDAVTVANTIVHAIPTGSEIFEIVNVTEIPGVALQLTGKTGTATLEVVIVTRNGVAFTIEQNVDVCYAAEDAEFVEVNDNGEETNIVRKEMFVGDSFQLSAHLIFAVVEQEAQELLGNISVAENGTVTILHPEMIKSYTWSSEQTAVASVSGKNAEICTVNAVAAGTAVITLSIETESGRTITAEITIVVKDAPANP